MSYIIGSWREGMGTVSAAIDQNFGERLTLIACISQPNFPTDRDRRIEPVTLRGEFMYRARLALDNGRGKGGQHGSGGLVESQQPIFTFSHVALPFLPQRGDRVRREIDGTLWEITRCSTDGVSRVTCEAVELGVSSP